MPGRIVAENDFADHTLVFGEMSFFDQVITGVVFILQSKSKLLLCPKNLSTKKSSVLIQLPANFFAQLAIFARGGGDGFVIGRIGFVNSARAIGVEDDADANLAVFFLGDRAARSDCDAEEKGKNEAAHDVLVGAGEGRRESGRRKGEAMRRAKGGSAAPSGNARYRGSPAKLMTSRSEPDWRDCWIYPERCVLLNFSG